jgi:hypothetical protein
MNELQKEALRKLADSLEECRACGVSVELGDHVAELFFGVRGVWIDLRSMSALEIRKAISSEVNHKND